MNISPYALFSGLFAGAGGAAGAVGQSMAEEQKRAEVERLARDKMAQEQQYRDAMLTLERDKVNQSATPYGAIYKALGLPVPGNVDPNERVANDLAAKVMTGLQEQQKVQRETTGRLAQADLIRQSAQGVPAQLTGQLAPGEDPEAAALIPRTAGTPPPANAQERLLAAGLHEKSALGSPLLEKILGLGEDTWKPLPENSPGVYDRYGNFKPIESRTGATAEPPLPPGYQRSYAYDKNNRRSVNDKPLEARDDFDRAAQQMGFPRFEEVPPERQTQLWDAVKKFRGDIAARTGEGAAIGANQAKQSFPLGGDATKFIHPQTGQAPSSTMTRGDATAAGYVEVQHPADRAAFADLQSTKATVYQLSQMADKLITATNPMEAGVQGTKLHAGALTKSNALAATYYDTKQAFLGTLSRSLGGERGVLTNQDITRVSGALASFWDTVDVKNAKNAILQNLLDTATEAKMSAMTGQPAGEGYKQRIQDLIGQMEQGAAAAPVVAGPNKLSRQDPLYGHARSRGLTDQQIQNKYGITLVP